MIPVKVVQEISQSVANLPILGIERPAHGMVSTKINDETVFVAVSRICLRNRKIYATSKPRQCSHFNKKIRLRFNFRC